MDALSRAFHNAAAMLKTKTISPVNNNNCLMVVNNTQTPTGNDAVNEKGDAFNVKEANDDIAVYNIQPISSTTKRAMDNKEDTTTINKRPKQMNDVINQIAQMNSRINKNIESSSSSKDKQNKFDVKSSVIKLNVLNAINRIPVASQSVNNIKPQSSSTTMKKAKSLNIPRVRENFCIRITMKNGHGVKKSTTLQMLLNVFNRSDDQVRMCCVSFMPNMGKLDSDDIFSRDVVPDETYMYIFISMKIAMKENVLHDVVKNQILSVQLKRPEYLQSIEFNGVKNVGTTIKWITSSDSNPGTYKIDSSDLSLMAQIYLWVFTYPIEATEPSESDAFLIQHLNSRMSLLSSFRDIRNKRLVNREAGKFNGCKCCEFTTAKLEMESSQLNNTSNVNFIPCTCEAIDNGLCGMMAAICYNMRNPSNNVRLYVCGASGFGKTRIIQDHVSSLMTFLPIAMNEQFTMDGFTSANTSLIYFDEFDQINFPRWLVLRLLDRQYFSINQKYKTVIQGRFDGPIAFSSVLSPNRDDEEFLRRLDAFYMLDHKIFDCEGECKYCPLHGMHGNLN